MRLCKQYFWELCYRSNTILFPSLPSVILTNTWGLPWEKSRKLCKVDRRVSSLHNCLEFRRDYVNTELVFFCCCKGLTAKIYHTFSRLGIFLEWWREASWCASCVFRVLNRRRFTKFFEKKQAHSSVFGLNWKAKAFILSLFSFGDEPNV